jgi:streptogramin lyase
MRRSKQIAVSLLVVLAIGLALVVPLALTETAAAYNSMNEYATTGTSNPFSICAGPDGNIWFTEMATSKIGRIRPDGTGLAEYPTTGTIVPFGICAGPDGNIWFAESSTNKIGKMGTDGTLLAEYLTTGASKPSGICAGPDGNIWFAEENTNNIGRMKTDGTVLGEYPTIGVSKPQNVCAGPDGTSIWFTTKETNMVGKIGTDGTGLAEYPTTGTSNPFSICAGPDGNIWFTEYGTSKIGMIKTDGTGLLEYPTTTGASKPIGICAAPDGDLWFAEMASNNIGRLTTTVPIVPSSFYFAEGTTRSNFAEYLCIGNPTDSAATANVTYMFSDSTTKDTSYTVPGNSRFTVSVNSEVGPEKDVSIRILSSTPNLVAERPMYFNYNGRWTGGSDALGAVSPNRNWYFAEGNTLPEFDEYVTVLNPGGTTANLTFHYMVEGAGQTDVTAQVGPNTRATFKTKDQIGNGKNASLYLEGTQDVVAERPMYFNYLGLAMNNWTGGHDVVGTNSPAKDWYFAEGTTRKNSTDGAFEEWLCLQNPGSSAITVNATYQLGAGQGTPVARSCAVPAQQRLTVSVNRELGQDKDCSVHLNSTSDFIAERPMYFSYHSVAWTGGHDVLGANSTATTWFFAEGTTRDNFEEWLCLQNTGNGDAHATITYYTTSGQVINKSWTVSANTRLTVSVNGDVGANQDISARVSSDNPIIVERPMYFNYQGVWNGGHDVVGFVPAQ